MGKGIWEDIARRFPVYPLDFTDGMWPHSPSGDLPVAQPRTTRVAVQQPQDTLHPVPHS